MCMVPHAVCLAKHFSGSSESIISQFFILSQVFAEFFDKVIDERHNGYKPWDKHPTDLDHTKIRGGCFDEK